MPLLKICGTTSTVDAQLAADLGADYLGIIVEHPPSPRSVGLGQAVEIRSAVACPVVAVTVNQSLTRLLEIWDELRPAALQLHGDESPNLIAQLKERDVTVWSVLHGDNVPAQAQHATEAGVDAILVDARDTAGGETIYGGTGLHSDWEMARTLVEQGYRVILAGGLTPENVAAAIHAVNPWMVDVVSGVEASKGVKDAGKLRAFAKAVQAARRLKPRQEG